MVLHLFFHHQRLIIFHINKKKPTTIHGTALIVDTKTITGLLFVENAGKVNNKLKEIYQLKEVYQLTLFLFSIFKASSPFPLVRGFFMWQLDILLTQEIRKY